MDVVRALVGVHDFEVDHVADHAELIRNAIAASRLQLKKPEGPAPG